jgi:aminopeptidase N
MKIERLRYNPWLVISLLLPFHAIGQQHQDRLQKIDVQHYDFSISLSDTSDVIYSSAEIKVLFKEPVKSFSLDLAGKDENGKGMVVKRVSVNGIETRFRHVNDSLYIFPGKTEANTSATINIEYSGVPADGLVISKNKFGDRTFFGDNWPDRAYNWLACIDHPSDKATVEFEVSVPAHYEVIATGDLVEEKPAGKNYKLIHWQSDVPLPTKVMVIGVADFAIDNIENNLNIPLSTWAYPENTTEWFAFFRNSTEPVLFFTNSIGPYPFSKLANVQSTTIFGGMENAGNIFYRENLLAGGQRDEEIIVHEIAHQWFGNSLSEGNWYDVWLSEGFATYLTDLFYEYKYGRDVFKRKMNSERNMVIRYARRNYSPVIDTTITEYMDLININSYEKGAWVLHMLRKQLGDELFMNCIRTFYEKHKYSNAITEDFQDLVEVLSGKDMDVFFEQWLRKPGHPVLNITWYQKRKSVCVKIEQLQKGPAFDFQIDLAFTGLDSSMRTETIHITKVLDTFRFPVEGKIKSLVHDPEVWLLYEGTITRKKF